MMNMTECDLPIMLPGFEMMKTVYTIQIVCFIPSGSSSFDRSSLFTWVIRSSVIQLTRKLQMCIVMVDYNTLINSDSV